MEASRRTQPKRKASELDQSSSSGSPSTPSLSSPSSASPRPSRKRERRLEEEWEHVDKFGIRKRTKRFSDLHKVGEGAHGVVYRAFDKTTAQTVALKRLRLAPTENGLPAAVVREVSLLRALDHPNVVRLLDAVHCNHHLQLVFEFVERDLRQAVRAQRLDVPTIKRITAQVLSGVHHCHTHRVIHRDLKPHNILLTDAMEAKLADFGLSCNVDGRAGPLTAEVVTLWYRAPELLLGDRNYTAAVDMWSVGCVVAEMLHGSCPFQGESEIDQLLTIFRHVGTPTEQDWSGVRSLANFSSSFPRFHPRLVREYVPRLDAAGADFLGKLLVANPKRRMTAKRALQHAWLRGFTPTTPSQP